jgi:hypothetical protein
MLVRWLFNKHDLDYFLLFYGNYLDTDGLNLTGFNKFVYNKEKTIFVLIFQMINFLKVNSVKSILTVKKQYSRPEIACTKLDNSISLVMMTAPVNPPQPRGDGKKGNDDPFTSPFGDKPFG